MRVLVTRHPLLHPPTSLSTMTSKAKSSDVKVLKGQEGGAKLRVLMLL